MWTQGTQRLTLILLVLLLLSSKKCKCQKRAGEPSGRARLAPNAEFKRRKIAEKLDFRIAGFKFPYINNSAKLLPQSESESYALTFFEQKPNYYTNYLIDSVGDTESDLLNADGNDDDENEDDDDDNNDPVGQGSKYVNPKKERIILNMIQKRLRRDWFDIYKKKKYKDWLTWWTDFKWCGVEIEKQLGTFSNLSLRYHFIPSYPNATTEKVVKKVLKCAHLAFEKNGFSYYRYMRTVFLLMNETFLENLSSKNVEHLQEIIRNIPNSVWLFKMRSMVFFWQKHYAIIQRGGRDSDAIIKQWRNPVFHWFAKQAYDELKTISEIAWPQHKELFATLQRE